MSNETTIPGIAKDVALGAGLSKATSAGLEGLGKVGKQAVNLASKIDDPFSRAASIAEPVLKDHLSTTAGAALGGMVGGGMVGSMAGMAAGGTVKEQVGKAVGSAFTKATPAIMKADDVFNKTIGITADKVQNMSPKYRQLLSNAAAAGGRSLAITHFILGQSDPGYQSEVQKFNTPDQ
jgi:hypothetical protein